MIVVIFSGFVANLLWMSASGYVFDLYKLKGEAERILLASSKYRPDLLLPHYSSLSFPFPSFISLSLTATLNYSHVLSLSLSPSINNLTSN
jgi:hypothetical protein